MNTGTEITVGAMCSEPASANAAAGHRRLLRLLKDTDARNTLLCLIDQAAVSGGSFATSVLLGRFCAAEDLGIYYLAVSLLFFVMGVQAELVSVPYTIYRPRRQGADLALYAGSSLIHQSVLSLAAVLLLAAAAALAAWLEPDGSLGSTLAVLAAAAPFVLLRDFVRRFTFAHFQLRHACLLDVSVVALQLGGLFALARSGMLSPAAVYVVMAAACALPCLAWFLLQRQPMKFERRRVVEDWRHNWIFARWALATQLIGSSTPFMLPWLVMSLRDETATGLLAASDTLCGLAYAFVTAVCHYLTPRAAAAFASGGVAPLRRVLLKAGGLFVATLGPFSLAAICFGRDVLDLVYGAEYGDAWLVLATLSVAALISSLGVTAGNGLWAIEQPKANFMADVVTLTVTIGVALGLVGSMGALGAAVATLAGACVGAVVRVARLLRSWAELHTPCPAQAV